MKRNSLSTTLKDYMTQSNNTTVTSSSSSKSPIIIKESPSSSSYANKNQMVKELWDCNANSSHSGEEYMNGFPWPPRSYTCSFCRKEFKSAQALGGHMNVHRRDRARLRQSPPISTADHHHGQGPMLNLNLNPTTTNPSFSTSPLSLLPSSSSSTSCASHKPVTSTLPLFVSAPPPPPPPAASPAELKRWFVMDGILVSPVSTKASSEPTKPKIADQSLSAVGGYDAFTREDGCKILKKAEILRMDLEIGLPRNYDLDLELRLGTYS